jgi:2-deoxy-D-gluconate 3-dehydrogenase
MTTADFAGKLVVLMGGATPLGAEIERRFVAAGATTLPVHSNANVSRALDASGFQQGIDVWINLGGVDLPGPAERISAPDWNAYLEARLSATFLGAQAAGRHMLERGTGVIVNLVSEAAFMPVEGSAARSIAEAGIVMLTQALGIEWAKRGVRVVGVCAGPLEVDAADSVKRRSPLHRAGRLGEVAEAVLYVASNQASYVVGETLRVDGGWTAYQLF